MDTTSILLLDLRAEEQKVRVWFNRTARRLVPRSTPTVATAITITLAPRGSVLGLARRDQHLLSRRDPTPFTTRA